MAATAIAPIGARQINSSLYVGQSDLRTIQQAVTFGVQAGGKWAVIVPAGYVGTDTIAAVTGGSAEVYITDERGSQPLWWVWDGTAYIGAVMEIDAIMCETLDAVDVTAANGDFDTCIVANSPVRTFDNTPDGPGEGMVWPDIGIPVSEGSTWGPSIDPATVAYRNQANRFALQQNFAWNSAGGITAPAGGGTTIGWGLRNNDETDFINAHAGAAGGFAWYTALQGTALAAATQSLMSLDQLGNLSVGQGILALGDRGTGFNAAPGGHVATVSGSSTSGNLVLNAAATNSAGLSACGVYLNYTQGGTGTHFGNGAGIVVATIDQYGNIATQGNLGGGGNVAGSMTIGPNGGLTVCWNLSNGAGETDFINCAGGVAGGFRWYNGEPGTALTSATIPSMNLSATGNLSLLGGLYGNGVVLAGTANPAITLATSRSYSTYIYTNPTTPTQSIINCTGDGGSRGTLQIGGIGPGGPLGYLAYLDVTAGGITAAGSVTATGSIVANGQLATFGPSTRLSFIGGNGYVDAFGTSTTTGGPLYIRNVSSNASFVVNTLVLDGAGNCHVYGTMSAGTKSFRIDHPTEDGKWLVHGSLEGPEYGVYYRGEGVTVDSWAEVELPDYFEALTTKEGRTVYLTPFFEDESELCSTVAASRVKDGKFKVWSALPSQKFYWMVMAVRGDVPPLEVVQERIPDPPSTFDTPTQQPEMPDNEQASPDAEASRTTKRSGTAKDGTHHSPRPLPATAIADHTKRPNRPHQSGRR
jgi:hypothetical protein